MLQKILEHFYLLQFHASNKVKYFKKLRSDQNAPIICDIMKNDRTVGAHII